MAHFGGLGASKRQKPPKMTYLGVFWSWRAVRWSMVLLFAQDLRLERPPCCPRHVYTTLGASNYIKRQQSYAPGRPCPPPQLHVNIATSLLRCPFLNPSRCGVVNVNGFSQFESQLHSYKLVTELMLECWSYEHCDVSDVIGVNIEPRLAHRIAPNIYLQSSRILMAVLCKTG